MIYHVLLYEYPAGKLLLDIVFKKMIKEDDLFTAFVSALKIFGTSLLQKAVKNIKRIKFDNLHLDIFPLKKIGVDVIIIYDPKHQRVVSSIIDKITDIIFEYKSLFLNWDGITTSEFRILEEPIKHVIRQTIFSKTIAGAI